MKEIVLTGINLGDFGKGAMAESIMKKVFELIKALDTETAIERYRISSIEPNLLTDEIITWVAQSKNSCRISTFLCKVDRMQF